MMTNEEAINLRISRRTYERIPIAANHVQPLQQLIEEYRSCSGLSVKLILNNGEAFDGFRRTYGLLSGVENFFLLSGYKEVDDLFEKAGYFGECLVLEATKRGLGTCWVGGSFDKTIAQRSIQQNEEVICAIAVGNVAKEPAMKERTLRKLTHIRKSKSIEEMCSGTKPYPEWFQRGMRFVQKAPSAANKQPVHFFYSEDCVCASIKNMRGLTPVDLGIAKLHFELGAQCGYWEWGNGGRFITNRIA